MKLSQVAAAGVGSVHGWQRGGTSRRVWGVGGSMQVGGGGEGGGGGDGGGGGVRYILMLVQGLILYVD